MLLQDAAQDVRKDSRAANRARKVTGAPRDVRKVSRVAAPTRVVPKSFPVAKSTVNNQRSATDKRRGRRRNARQNCKEHNDDYDDEVNDDDPESPYLGHIHFQIAFRDDVGDDDMLPTKYCGICGRATMYSSCKECGFDISDANDAGDDDDDENAPCRRCNELTVGAYCQPCILEISEEQRVREPMILTPRPCITCGTLTVGGFCKACIDSVSGYNDDDDWSDDDDPVFNAIFGPPLAKRKCTVPTPPTAVQFISRFLTTHAASPVAAAPVAAASDAAAPDDDEWDEVVFKPRGAPVAPLCTEGLKHAAVGTYTDPKEPVRWEKITDLRQIWDRPHGVPTKYGPYTFYLPYPD
jgi:hypothetical protein